MTAPQVALSLRDRKAERAIDVDWQCRATFDDPRQRMRSRAERAIDVDRPCRATRTPGFPVAERQGYFPAAMISRRDARIRQLQNFVGQVLLAALALTLTIPTLEACAQSAGVPAAPPKNVVEALPEKPPEWLPGYQIRYTLRCLQDVSKSTSKSVVARLPTGHWLRADGAELAVQAADGTPIPVSVLSHAATGETLIQFPRHSADVWYWAYAASPQASAAAAPPIAEGVVLEVRDWPGGDLSSWTAVRDALTKSGPVLANAFTAEILQRANPARPATPKNYAVTYRGTLNIKQDGVYRFFVNSEDASFLFIDGFKVCDRPGANARVRGTIPVRSIGNDVELKAGLHPIEAHHVLAENNDTYGGCTLLWVPPGAKAWVAVPREAFAQPDFAHVAALEAQGPQTAAAFEHGIDDVLVSAGGATLHLVRFEAVGDLPDEKSLAWDFGDGTRATGRSVRHVYFAPGDYQVKLATGGPFGYERRVHVWAVPGEISPFSVGQIIDTLRGEWRTFPPDRQDQALDFLLTCDDPHKWPLVAEVARARLQVTGLDPQFRKQLYVSLIEAIAQSGKPAELQPIVAAAEKEFVKLPTLLVGVELAEADAWLRRFRDPDEAAKRYEAALQKHRRLEHPDVRRVAIGYGDLLTERGEVKAAAEMFKTAATLGGEEFLATAQSEAVTRGALLRVAEQKLRTGNILETRQLLAKIELYYPDQKLEGLYRFLKAESDRHAGRYEEALQSYELLMGLRQWAGYRDRAMHGVADCYARMDEVNKAIEWLEKIDKAYPAFYEKQGLPAKRLVLNARQEWRKTKPKGTAPSGAPPSNGKAAAPGSPPSEGAAGGVAFRDFATGFEPDEPESFGTSPTIRFVRGLGLFGPHVALLEEYPIYRGYLVYNKPLANLSPGGRYWVEAWYREDVFDLIPGFNPHTYFYVYGEGMQLHPTRGQGTYFPERSIGAWRKMGFVLEAPAGSNEGKLTLNTLAVGSVQLDGVSIRAVTDRQLDALSNFLDRTSEGATP